MHQKITGGKLLSCWLFLLFSLSAYGQRPTLEVGVRLQKTLNLYYENGATIQATHPALLHNRLKFGLTYVTSRLGSAANSNALKQDILFASVAYLFRHERALQPYVQANAGWFHADYESEIFQNLENTSPLLAMETGLSLRITPRAKAASSVGLNLITGDGSDSPGTLYPIFYQLSLMWALAR
ncbi:hypothetical protein ACXYMU_11580 [Pontibacter sp. CAU 1760]